MTIICLDLSGVEGPTASTAYSFDNWYPYPRESGTASLAVSDISTNSWQGGATAPRRVPVVECPSGGEGGADEHLVSMYLGMIVILAIMCAALLAMRR